MKRERLSESSPAFRILSVEPRCRHGSGCLQAQGVDNPDTSPHRHKLTFQVRSGVHLLSPPASVLSSGPSSAHLDRCSPRPPGPPAPAPHELCSPDSSQRAPGPPLRRTPRGSHLTQWEHSSVCRRCTVFPPLPRSHLPPDPRSSTLASAFRLGRHSLCTALLPGVLALGPPRLFPDFLPVSLPPCSHGTPSQTPYCSILLSFPQNPYLMSSHDILC